MIQSDKLAYLTDLSGSRGRTSGETALSAYSEEHEVFSEVITYCLSVSKPCI